MSFLESSSKWNIGRAVTIQQYVSHREIDADLFQIFTDTVYTFSN